jgi:hypothetical protein
MEKLHVLLVSNFKNFNSFTLTMGRKKFKVLIYKKINQQAIDFDMILVEQSCSLNKLSFYKQIIDSSKWKHNVFSIHFFDSHFKLPLLKKLLIQHLEIFDNNNLYDKITNILDGSAFIKKYKGYNYLRDILAIRLNNPEQYYKSIQMDLASKYNVNHLTIEKNIRFLISKNINYHSFTNLEVIDKMCALIQI